KSLFISKIYLFESERRKGYASRTVRFFERLCSMRNLEYMFLTVNKHNELALRAYKKLGFETVDAVETDIGNGFVMDDYIMEKAINTETA
ncbi:MAG: GNAT family N-acetyltransferase, partial [Raoultibacter sp.]